MTKKNAVHHFSRHKNRSQVIDYLPKGTLLHTSLCDNCNFRRPGSKQRQPSARHVRTQLPTARSSFSKSPEVSRSMVSSIWKPEMVMYLSNTAKQSVLHQGTANIPASAPQFRTMPPVCHYPQFRWYWPLTVLFWAPISHQMPLVQPFPAPGRNSSMHYSQWPKQIGKRDFWMGKE